MSDPIQTEETGGTEPRRRGRPPTEDGVAAKRGRVRPPVRDDDALARAEARAAEIREHLGGFDGGMDEFFIDPDAVPHGWSYEWKRAIVAGKEESTYLTQLARSGWQPVPASRHPEMMPKGLFEVIERKGMVLMERPQSITDEVRALDKRRARNQVRVKEEQLAQAPAGQFERQNKTEPLVKVNRSFAPMPVPEE